MTGEGSVLALDFETDDKLTLVSSDESNPREFSLDRKSAMACNLVKSILEGDQDVKRIEMMVTGDILEMVVRYLDHHKGETPSEIVMPIRSVNMGRIVEDEWDVEFVNGLPKKSIFQVILAANYMDIKSLLHLCCAKIASLLKGKTPEMIKKILREQYPRKSVLGVKRTASEALEMETASEALETETARKARKIDITVSTSKAQKASYGIEMDMDLSKVLLWSRSKKIKRADLICGEVEVYAESQKIAIARTNEPYWQVRVDTDANDVESLKDQVFGGIMGFKGHTAVLPFIGAFSMARYKRLGRAVMDIQTFSKQDILRPNGRKAHAVLGLNPADAYPDLAKVLSTDGSEVVFRALKLLRPVKKSSNAKDALTESMKGDRWIANRSTKKDMDIAGALIAVFEESDINLNSLGVVGQFVF